MSQLSTTWRAALSDETRPPDRPRPQVRDVLVPALTVLWHPDPRRVGDRVALQRAAAGGRDAVSRTEPILASPDGSSTAPLADPRISRSPFFLARAEAGALELDLAGSSTLVEADGVAVSSRRLVTDEELRRGLVLELSGRVALLLHLVPTTPAAPPSFGLVGDSPSILEVRCEIERLAPLDVPVLLRGESGTGKELAAQALHRRKGPFLAVNMGAIPPNLAAAELFGANRGAFTGADRPRVGYFQKADGGTLFLDEIGETPAEIQPLLLRALESGEIQPVGSPQPRTVSVRILAATDADLEQAVADGVFRAPLYHRVGAYELHLPPLRERRDDIGRLLLHFLRRELEPLGRLARLAPAGPDRRPWLPASVVARLARLDWPGNVRQLANVARRIAVEASSTEEICWTRRLEVHLQAGAKALHPSEPDAGESDRQPVDYRSPDDVDEEELLAAMSRHRYRPGPAAEELGVSRGSLYALIERSPKLRKAVDLDAEEIEPAIRRHGDLDTAARKLGVSADALKRRMGQLGLTWSR